MNVQTQQLTPAANPFPGVKIIDVDTHWSEPEDLWLSRAPAKYKDIVPQVHMKDGERWWFIDGKPFGQQSYASSVNAKGEKVLGMDFYPLKIDEIHAGSHQTKARVEVMDETGVYAQIVYPNLLGFGNNRAVNFSPEARMLATQLYNDAGAQMQADSNNRLFPMIMTPWWDINEAVAEIRRAHAMGLRGVNTNADPQESGMGDLGDPYWNPLWEVCVELNLPINFHIGGSQTQSTWFSTSAWPTLTTDAKLIAGGTMMFAGICSVMTNVILSGLLERYPKLQFVLVESGISWLPFIMDSLDYSVSQVKQEGIKHLTKLPSEYMRSNFASCFWFETKNLRSTIDRLGVDNVMWETDFPHPTCLYPDPLTVATESLQDFTAPEQHKIMGGNASRIYNIPVD
jgi:predicted TIM-barrel fold metal-dependent hydrolase